MALLIACSFRGFRFRSFSIRSSTDTNLCRDDGRLSRLCIWFNVAILLGVPIYERLFRIERDILSRGFSCVLVAGQVSR